MEISKQVISIDIAKRLKELGVKQESFFWWSYGNMCGWYIKCNSTPLKEDYSAFTVSELGEMLPYYNYEIIKSIRWIEFGCEFFKISFKDITEANARAKMLIYLIENGLVKNE